MSSKSHPRPPGRESAAAFRLPSEQCRGQHKHQSGAGPEMWCMLQTQEKGLWKGVSHRGAHAVRCQVACVDGCRGASAALPRSY